MSEPAHKRMTSDEFIAWAMEQPRRSLRAGGGRNRRHGAGARRRIRVTKFHIARRLAEAIEAGNLPCEALADGMAVEVDETTIYEPDALVRCGAPLPPERSSCSDPIIVVEVVSPSSQRPRCRRQA